MLIDLRNGMMAGGKLSAKSYIQDGLVANLDGIENAGWGVHDANATAWKELVSGRPKNVGSNAVFAQDYVSVPSNSPSIFDTKDLINSGSFTIECCAFCESYKSACTFGWSNYFSTYFAWGAADIYLTINKGFTLGAAGHGGPNKRLSCALTSHGGSTTIYFPHGGSSKTETFTFDNQTNGRLTLNGQSGGVCAIRLYSRALTADEIAHNYRIDKARFGLK